MTHLQSHSNCLLWCLGGKVYKILVILRAQKLRGGTDGLGLWGVFTNLEANLSPMPFPWEERKGERQEDDGARRMWREGATKWRWKMTI